MRYGALVGGIFVRGGAAGLCELSVLDGRFSLSSVIKLCSPSMPSSSGLGEIAFI